MIENIQLGVGVFCSWMMICMTLTYIQSQLGLRIKIKLPKNKKYDTKVNPIYHLKENHLNASYDIEKFVLKQDHNENWFFLKIFLPINLEIHTYSYFKEDSVSVSYKEGVYKENIIEAHITEQYISELYEKEYTAKVIEEVKRFKDELSYKVELDNINKTYHENYYG